MSSPDVGIEVGILSSRCQGNKNPARRALKAVWGQGQVGAMGWLDQIQFDGPLDSRPAIRDVEFAVDALGVGADCAQADYEFTGDLRPR